MRFLAHFSGEHPTMPGAEFRALFDAVGKPLTVLHETPRFLDGHAEVFADEVDAFLPRLGMTHLVCFHLFDGTPGAWPQDDVECCLPTGVPFAARAVRVDASSPWRRADVEREVGAILAPGRRIALQQPEVLVRPFLTKDRIYVGREVWASEPKELRKRHVENRPFFSPVSLEPKLARALINLSRAAPGATLYDPFCGTGGVLLEAAEMRLRVLGSDLDEEMVTGSRANLAHYGLADKAMVFESDVGESPHRLERLDVKEVDAIVTDLPYGRSASTGKESTGKLYARAFEAMSRVLRPGGYLVVGAATEPDVRLAERWFEPVDLFKLRRHRSLTRHFAVLRQR